MSLDPEIAFSVADETARIAQAAFPKGNLYLKMRDEIGALYEDPEFADLFPPQGATSGSSPASCHNHHCAIYRKTVGQASSRLRKEWIGS